MKKHPLARAFRVDKMTLAAMEATFFEYLDMENAKKTIPVLQMITVSGEELQNKADPAHRSHQGQDRRLYPGLRAL